MHPANNQTPNNQTPKTLQADIKIPSGFYLSGFLLMRCGTRSNKFMVRVGQIALMEAALMRFAHLKTDVIP